ncbi:hypothetical protein [Nostoc sp. MS1]|nr:hypothetical protein [Nostoc sp. MS1]
MSATVDIGTYREVNFRANSRQTLGELRRCDAIAWDALVVQSL